MTDQLRSQVETLIALACLVGNTGDLKRDAERRRKFHAAANPLAITQLLTALVGEIDVWRRKLAIICDQAIYSDSLGVNGSDFSVCRWCGGGSSPGKGDFKHNDGCLFADGVLERRVADVWDQPDYEEAS